MARGKNTAMPDMGKRAPTVSLSVSDYHKQVPIKGMEDCKMGSKVCCMIEGKVVGMRQDRYGKSIEIEMSKAGVGDKSAFEDMLENY